ncbi:hypothetical protein BGZ95_005905 [Linnemannia exigua]|uniref:Uncharacterized protein n=1 Tax=Linnemannia exigua TaxID=604196 RepID=A0AAD4D1G3_9FUNG|nr:hypothetical protein BGZ95_005905 [Linnemannia exigua]
MAKFDTGMKVKTQYERGWDTVMTSAAMAGIDDRILKKVSMRMKNLLSKSANPHYYETEPEGQWATGEDAIDKERKTHLKRGEGGTLGSEGDDRIEERKFVDPMDPDFDPLVMKIRAEYRRTRYLADAQQRNQHETATGSGKGSRAASSQGDDHNDPSHGHDDDDDDGRE